MPVPLVIVAGSLLARPIAQRALIGALTASQGPTVAKLEEWAQRLRTDEASDEALSAAASADFGSVMSVATWDMPFQPRKLQVQYDRDGGSPLGTDDAVTTHHFLKISGGNPVDAWDAADFTAVEGAFDTLWTALKALYTARTKLDAYRWYRVIPLTVDDLEEDPNAVETYGPPVRVVEKDVAGTDPATNGQLPPQVAMSVTEKTASRLHWGRFYLPAPHSGDGADQYGRIAGATLTVIADACDTFYEACYTAGIAPVVYSKAKRARPAASGETLPAVEARAYGVTDLQVDDLFDVIRSRRWKHPLLRVQRAIAGS